jgi:manganese/iron transport system permease protein
VTAFLAPFAHDFMLRGLVMAAMVGAVSAVLSCYLVLRGWSLMGDAVSHAVLPGIVTAYLLSLPLTLGAFLAGLLCALLTGWIKAGSRLKEDAVMGIVFSGLFALGLVMIVWNPGELHLSHVLFGNMLGVTDADIAETFLIAAPVLLIAVLFRRDFALVTFDPAHARALALPVRLIENALLVMLALAIVASMKAVGVILVVAMLIVPGAIGYLACRRFDGMMAIAVIAAVGSSLAGALASFWLDSASGPTIVVTQALVFAAVAAWQGWRGRVRPAR